jgi:hypothetical protein
VRDVKLNITEIKSRIMRTIKKYFPLIFVFLLCIFFTPSVLCETPQLEMSKTYGGTGEEIGNSVAVVGNSGYIIAGSNGNYPTRAPQ